MARPSKQAQRETEILDAFEQCVVRYGIEGATLQHIADEAGLARPLLRHYVGNREELVDALTERYIKKTEQITDDMRPWLPETNRAQAMIALFFDKEYASSNYDTLVAQALVVASQTRPLLREKLLAWFKRFEQLVVETIQSDFPDADQESVKLVAAGIIGIYFNADAMGPLGDLGGFHENSEQAALRLLATL